MGGKTRCCPPPKSPRVGTLRKHAGGMFLVPTTAAVPRGGGTRGTGDEILRCAQNDRDEGAATCGGTGGESHHRMRAVPLPLTREARTGDGRSRAPPLRVEGIWAGRRGSLPCGYAAPYGSACDGTAARRVVAPYGVYISAEVSWWAIRESPYGDYPSGRGRRGGQEGRDCFMAR